MNRREAKRTACWLAGGLIRGQLAHGWDTLWERPEEEGEKIEAALIELAKELERRGWTAQQEAER